MRKRLMVEKVDDFYNPNAEEGKVGDPGDWLGQSLTKLVSFRFTERSCPKN